MKVTVNYIGPDATSVTFHEEGTIPARAVVIRVEPLEDPRPGAYRAPGARPVPHFAVYVVRREGYAAGAGDGPHSLELGRKTVRL